MLTMTAAVVLAAAAAATPLDKAIRLYDAAKFSDAEKAFEALVDSASTAPADVDQARLYLAAMALTARDRATARHQLRALLRDKPASFAIDPLTFAPDLLALAYEVRVELERERPQAKPAEPAPVPAAPPAPAAPAAAVSAPRPGRPVVVWVPAILGVAGAITGGVLLGLSNARHDTLFSGAGPIYDGPRLASEGDAFQTGGFIALGAGLVLLAVGAVLVLVTGS